MNRKKKSKFLTFCFSLLPGAGEMYMGFMKRGVSIMALFFAVLALSTWFNLGPLLFLNAIVWFYGFFDVHNLNSLPDDVFMETQDDFIFHLGGEGDLNYLLFQKYRKVTALVLIVAGGTLLLQNVNSLFSWLLPSFIWNPLSFISYRIPQLVISVLIIMLGVQLIRGKKQKMDSDYPALPDHQAENTAEKEEEK
ncbi:hypothetical protein [Anaerolentibacter hominis]|uniref:hypothetical protein n=1 Tax=Anaerolentibacter hominis TaxID=3079009 RepID=UPI0031B89033